MKRARNPTGRGVGGKLAALVLAAACGGCGGEPDRSRGVLLVTIDGLRPDAVERLAEAGDSASALGAFARSSVAFADAWTPAPLALPAHASLLTGREPRVHGARDDGATAVAADVPNLAELLRADGFRARAAVSSSALAPGGGLERGFESFRAPRPPDLLFTPFAERRAEHTLDGALADLIELARSPEPFLYLLHLAEPLPPFDPPDVAADAPSAERYAGEVRTVDRALERLFAMLSSSGLAEELILVVTAPRGVAVADETMPGEDLAEDAVRVPLFLRAPGLAPGRVAGPVSLTDVAPTLLALLGIPPPAGMDGRDLSAAIAAGATPDGYTLGLETWHPWLAHGATPLAAVVRDGLVLARGPELVLRDRARGTEAIAPRDARAQALLAELELRFGSLDPAAETNDGTHVPRVLAAEELLAAGATGAARDLLADLVDAVPGDPTAARMLGALLLSGAQVTAADVARAEPVVERALARRPDDPILNRLLARCAAEREDAARRGLRAAEREGDADAVAEAEARIDAERARRIDALERAFARSPSSTALQRELELARARE